jgi:hypothetical protein
MAGVLALMARGNGAAAQTVSAGSADLSVCQEKGVAWPPGEDIDAREFARWLQGTWELRTRTIQGVTIDTDSRYYFDLEPGSPAAVRGSALMLDRGNLSNMDPLGKCKACLADAAVGALWEVAITTSDDRKRVDLVMDGDYLGSYGDFTKGMRHTERASFVRYRDIYLASDLTSPAGGQGLPDDVWDRISVTRDVIVYVSCKGGFLDRFIKVSNDRPLVDGRDLRQVWAVRKVDGSLVSPVPVPRYDPRKRP